MAAATIELLWIAAYTVFTGIWFVGSGFLSHVLSRGNQKGHDRVYVCLLFAYFAIAAFLMKV